jgi:hypothetical protein
MIQQMTREQRNALITVQRITEAMVATVNETFDGAPAGVLYAALMAYMTYDQFLVMMNLLVNIGKVTKRGHLYFPAGAK